MNAPILSCVNTPEDDYDYEDNMSIKRTHMTTKVLILIALHRMMPTKKGIGTGLMTARRMRMMARTMRQIMMTQTSIMTITKPDTKRGIAMVMTKVIISNYPLANLYMQILYEKET